MTIPFHSLHVNVDLAFLFQCHDFYAQYMEGSVEASKQGMHTISTSFH